MLSNGIDLCLFDVHDAKMMFNLTLYSKWNCAHHLFLLWKFKRSEEVKKATSHKCKMNSDEEQISYYNKSREELKLKYYDDYCMKNVSKHCDWYHDKNRGFTHFGIHSKYLPLSSIAFDNLHCRLSIVRLILNFIRDFIDRFGYDLHQNFYSILRIQICQYYVQCFETSKALSCMYGKKIDQFIDIAPKGMHFFKHNFEETTIVYVVTLS